MPDLSNAAMMDAKEKEQDLAAVMSASDNKEFYTPEKPIEIQRDDPRLKEDPGFLLRKFVVLHDGIGKFVRGDVCTPLDFFGDELHLDKNRYRRLMFSHPDLSDATRRHKAMRFLATEEIKELFNRLVTLNAVREATSFESTLPHVTLPEAQSTAIASEETIQRLRQELEAKNAELAKLNNLSHLAQMRDAQTQMMMNMPIGNQVDALAAKDAEIADLRAALSHKPTFQPPMPGIEIPDAPPIPSANDVSIDKIKTDPVETTKLHRPGAASKEQPRKGRGAGIE